MPLLCILSLIAGASFASFRHVLALAFGTLAFATLLTFCFTIANNWSLGTATIAFLAGAALFQTGYILTAMARYARTTQVPRPQTTKSRLL